MFEPLLIQPQIIEISHQSKLVFSLSKQFGDFSALQLQSGPIVEVVVVAVSAAKVSLMVRIHPYLSLSVDEFDNDMDTSESLSRSVGQGWRLFSALGTSPKLCAAQLGAGLSVAVSFSDVCRFNIVEAVKWNLVALEADFRIGHIAKEILLAKHIIARSVDAEHNAESLLVEISELESVRFELTRASKEGHQQEFSKLDAELVRKRQLLTRQYSQLSERPNLSLAANQSIEQEQLIRQLAYYQLLAPIELNEIVEQLMADGTNGSFALENE